jgi:pimeloyl-ACP methyl ester carboxylesterase
MADGTRHRRNISRAGFDRLVESAAGGLLLRPWFDDATLKLLTQWFFPLSRGWAAAIAAGGSVGRFLDTLPCGRFSRRLLPPILARMEARCATLATIDAEWERAFFGCGPGRAEIELLRMRSASALMNLRTSLVPLHIEAPMPPVAWNVESPTSVAHRHGHRLESPQQAFSTPLDLSSMEPSRGFLSASGVEGWVRFPAPTLPAAGKAWARVSAPAVAAVRGRPAMPSLIFAHGIAVETEFMGNRRNLLSALVAAGVRVIRPEGPWHGRRRLAGSYGGEPVLARGPGGLLDYFHAHVIELGHLVAWARTTAGGPVAIGGVSLGALTAQLAAVAARYWPEEMRPDALFLVAPSHSLTAITFEGTLTRALGVPDAIRAAGWTLRDVEHWRPLLEPLEAPAVPADRIVVVIGMSDDVTLTAGGEALVRHWAVPEDNVFRSPAGHFSTSLGLARDAAPFRRLLEILRS